MVKSNCAVPIITIDGPVGSGKGSVSVLVAQKLGWHLLDSGVLYRLIALCANDKGVDLDNVGELKQLAEKLDVEFVTSKRNEPAMIFLEGKEVDKKVRSEDCGAWAAKISAYPEIRQALLQRQRDFARLPGLVADGRDMGTEIFAEASLKIYLTASLEQRARRRLTQLQARGLSGNLPSLLKEIAQRDERDKNRAISPLRVAEGATVIDSTELSIAQVVSLILQKLN